jgi:hypothetical protein
MKMRVLATLAMCAAMSGAWADDKNGQYGILTDTCAEYAKDRAKNRTLRYTSWIAGYVTGYNSVAPDTYNILGKSNVKSATEWLDKWCKANPSESLAGGLHAFVKELHPARRRFAASDE